MKKLQVLYWILRYLQYWAMLGTGVVGILTFGLIRQKEIPG